MGGTLNAVRWEFALGRALVPSTNAPATAAAITNAGSLRFGQIHAATAPQAATYVRMLSRVLSIAPGVKSRPMKAIDNKIRCVVVRTHGMTIMAAGNATLIC